MTNCPKHFQKFSILETGLSDSYKIILTVLKSEIPHERLKVISYRNYRRFNKHEFEKEITNTISALKISSKGFEVFITIVNNSLNKQTPLKTKHLRANHSDFITKDLSKAIMD